MRLDLQSVAYHLRLASASFFELLSLDFVFVPVAYRHEYVTFILHICTFSGNFFQEHLLSISFFIFRSTEGSTS